MERRSASQTTPINKDRFQIYRRSLPAWLCSDDCWTSTQAAVADNARVKISDSERPVLEMLEMHWHRHRDACASALKTVNVFNLYLRHILDTFNGITDDNIDKFVSDFTEATEQISMLREHLSKDKETGVRWADVLMNRHLVAASSGDVTQFDPSELAHALKVVCQGDQKIDIELILTALHLLCDMQRSDGSWACQQPFFWTDTGMSTSTQSINTAGAIVSTVNALLQNPERHGTNVEECAASLHKVYHALDRFFRWLPHASKPFRSRVL